jgi:hypothetical protein
MERGWILEEKAFQLRLEQFIESLCVPPPPPLPSLEPRPGRKLFVIKLAPLSGAFHGTHFPPIHGFDAMISQKNGIFYDYDFP